MDEIPPCVQQRFCVRHLYNNFRRKFFGKLLKETIWKIAISTYPQAWRREMEVMRVVNEEVFLYMMKTPLRFWSKLQFRTHAKCYFVLN